MERETGKIIESTVEPDATLQPDSMVIRSRVGKMCRIGRFSKVAYSTIGDLSYVGEYSVVTSASIGKFTSVSWGVSVGPEDHDYRKVTNHSFLYSTKSFRLVTDRLYDPFEKRCIIGSDVWVGCNATILRGVQVGDGAVVGANALVNRDVPPYAIVAGVPAAIVKYRFDPMIIDQIRETRWWDLAVEVIADHVDLFARHPDEQVIAAIRKLDR